MALRRPRFAINANAPDTRPATLVMRRFLLLWLVLVIASNGWRLLNPLQPVADAQQTIVPLLARDGNTLTDQHIGVAIREYGQTDDKTALPIILLHGTPIASKAMRGLAQLLARDFQVISPDLPGFAGSAQALPDYSSITHARYVADLMDALSIPRAHIVAYSQGGAAAISFTEFYPERTVSLALLSTIGVQELELFGSYRFNHAVYAGQLAIWRAAQWLLPHFGTLDDAILGTGYTRNLTDTDQRVLRDYLQRIEAPALIVHGKKDGLVPYAAALEHYRLLPQSTLVTLDAGHEPAYASPAMFIEQLAQFLHQAESPEAVTRSIAPAARVSAAQAPFDAAARDPVTGFALIVLVLAIIVASYVSEDLTCIATGLLVAEGIVSLPMGVSACLVGLFTGDIALFLAGRWLGPPTLRRLTSESKLAAATRWLRKRGPLVIIASRFMPGTRLPTYIAAGALRMPLPLFVIYFAIATLIWTPLLVGVAAAYGEIAEQWFSRYAAVGVWLVIAGALLLWFILQLVMHAMSWEGRRLLRGRWARLTRFEFWPRWAFYTPVVVANLFFAIRHRSLTLFTIANPGIPLSGITGESKADILQTLAPSGCVAPFCILRAGDAQQATDARQHVLDAFVEGAGNDYPLILKPERGERGKDVAIVADRAAAQEYLSKHCDTIIAQRRVFGNEFGILYIREPNAATGNVVSVARKSNTVVTGNGTQSLKALILADSRAVCMAPYFFDAHAQRLDWIPANGEPVALNSIGTHSRGSVFTDAQHLLSNALVAEIERISRHFEGFHIGRYDLFVDDDAALTAGRDIQIVELNGLTSEPAHIYNPGISVWHAWRVVISQWRRAWRIAAMLREHGVKPPSVRAVIRGLRDPNSLTTH
ncbi:MAG: alpha/beta fold hydrolase [Pseudomonadota bacterium]